CWEQFVLFRLLVWIWLTYGCGTPTFEPNTNRNVNGEDARAHSWPWQISMQMKHGSRWHHTCGGTVIGSYWVLTAGHCIWPGDSVQEGTEQIRDVLHILVHADWDMVAAGEYPSDRPKKCQRLPQTLYKICPMPDQLQQALLLLVGNSVCSQSDWRDMVVKDTMICGDSGGPLNCKRTDGKWYVQGVTSFVSSSICNEVKISSVFTLISEGIANFTVYICGEEHCGGGNGHVNLVVT
uniref:Peptidase S1 domain-containing protein n=1 Tax=Oncorhynchus kisutch TaxID=8019 RepID=A0A8C7FE55_ONCKI